MFLKLTQFKRQLIGANGTLEPAKPEYTWVNFNNVTEMETRLSKQKDGTDVEYTLLFFNTSTHEDQSSTMVKESPDIICQMLLEKTAVKVLYGGK